MQHRHVGLPAGELHRGRRSTTSRWRSRSRASSSRWCSSRSCSQWRTVAVALVDDSGVARRGRARARPARRDLQRDLVRRPRGRARDRDRRRGRRAPRTSRGGCARTRGRDGARRVAARRASTRRTRCAARWPTRRSSRCSRSLPVAVMEGRPGAFFGPLALAYALAVLAVDARRAHRSRRRSASCCSRSGPPARRRPRSCGALARALRRGARRVVRRPRAVLLAVAASRAVVGLATLPFLATSAVPAFKDRDVLVRLDGRAGHVAARDDADRDARSSRELRAVPGVEQRGRPRRPRDHRRPGRRRQLRRALGRASTPDADYDATLAVDRGRRRRLPAAWSRRHHLLGADDP